MKPLAHQINYHKMLDLFKILADQPHTLFFDGCPDVYANEKFSYLVFSPFAVLQAKNQHYFWNEKCLNESDIFDVLDQKMQTFRQEHDPSLPPFQGGAAGLLSYDLMRQFESLPQQAVDLDHTPDLQLGFYDVVFAFDHRQQLAWVISSGWPATTTAARQARAQQRLDTALELLQQPVPEDRPYSALSDSVLTSNFTPEQYQLAVEKIKKYIANGDVFQANLSQRFHGNKPKNMGAKSLYLSLRQLNPAPFSAYANLGEQQLLSSSPERFLEISDQVIKACPIKGTRPRHNDPNLDNKLKNQLMNSNKDRAENHMIVDLMRNDLSRVCLANSISVPQLNALNSFKNVHHLISEVHGQLKPQTQFSDVLKATLAAGSITGAPKIRAMEIIDELEPSRRGAYCGQLCWLGFNGQLDSNILIRTIVMTKNQLYFQVGGAVLLHSKPQEEYHETWHKAQGMLHCLTQDPDVVGKILNRQKNNRSLKPC